MGGRCDVHPDRGRNYLLGGDSRCLFTPSRGLVHVTEAGRRVDGRALQMAVRTRYPAQVIHHSDHGSQYTSQKFRQAGAAANREVFCYLEGFYNPRRIHLALDYQSPAAYERRYALEQGSTAILNKRNSRRLHPISYRNLQCGMIFGTSRCSDICTWTDGYPIDRYL